MNKKQALGQRIKEIRKAKKISQEELAEKVGLEPPSICNIENGKNFPTLQNLEKITNVLGISFTEVFEFEHIKTNEQLIEEINTILANNKDKVRNIYKIVKAIVE